MLILVLLAQFTRDLGGGDEDRQFNVPFGVSPIVRIGQFFNCNFIYRATKRCADCYSIHIDSSKWK